MSTHELSISHPTMPPNHVATHLNERRRLPSEEEADGDLRGAAAVQGVAADLVAGLLDDAGEGGGRVRLVERCRDCNQRDP